MHAIKASRSFEGKLERLISSIEDGRFFIAAQATVVSLAVIVAIITGIDISSGVGTGIETAQRNVYTIKRVSTIPLKQRDMTADAFIEDTKEDEITVEELRRRYINYVIARIEQNKIYPIEEQKLGHEGSVSVQLYIEKNGIVRKAVILRQARYSKLTESAIASIKRSIPFIPFPRGIPEDEIILKLNIEYYLK